MRASLRSDRSKSWLVLALLAACGCASASRTPVRSIAQAPAADLSPASRKIPNPEAFLGWFDEPGFKSSDLDLGKVERIELACGDPNVYPAYPQESGKLYHAYQVGRYDHFKLTGDDEPCVLAARAKSSRGSRSCMMADTIEYAVISDVYRDACGNFFRGYWDVLFLHRNDTMGTLLSRGRTVFPDPRSQFQGAMVVGETYAVPAREFLFFSSLLPGDSQRIEKFRAQALERTHRFDDRTLLFAPRQ